LKGHQLQIEPCGPFRLDLTAWALRRRAHNAVDRWDAATYERVVSLDGGPVSLSVTQAAGPDAPRLSVLLAGRPVDQPAEALSRSALNRLFGLTVDLSPFAAMAASDPLLGPLAARMRGLKPPRFPTVFEALVNGVACQQLSLAVGIHLLNRLAADRGKAVSDEARARSPTLRSSPSWSPTTSSATASAPRRLARSSTPPRRSSPTISTWRPSKGSRMPRRSSA
jgi:DNA-3-methyladenine glycosylase II